jgi:hypothetical protein
MVPTVKPYLYNTLDLLDNRGFRNHVLIITRYKVNEDDCDKLNSYQNIKPTLLVTYSGIEDDRIEPIDNAIPIASLKTAFAKAERYKVILYWRPIVPGLNDSAAQIDFALRNLSRHAHATVFTGLFYIKQIRDFFVTNGLPDIYQGVARRKIFPDSLEKRILDVHASLPHTVNLFRKTSCGVAFAHGEADYNGHYGIQELCDICPRDQFNLCAQHHVVPTVERIQRLGSEIGLPALDVGYNGERAIRVEGLDEDQRYFLQHNLRYQVHNTLYPHDHGQHGRAAEFRDFDKG